MMFLAQKTNLDAMLSDYPWMQFIIEDDWDISGNRLVVVYDNTVAFRPFDPTNQVYLIVKNFNTGANQILTGRELPCGPEQIDMWTDWVVMKVTCLKWPGWHYELWAYNLTTEERVVITPPPSAPPEQTIPTQPVIDNNRIVWLQYDSNSTSADLYLYDLQSRTATALTHDRGPMAELFPDMDGDWVVWNGFNQNNNQQYVVAYNLTSHKQITESMVLPAYYALPKINNDLVVWTDYRNGLDNGDIYGLHLQEVTEPFPVVAEPGTQYNVALDDNLLVYKNRDLNSETQLRLFDLENSSSFFLYHYPSEFVDGYPFIDNGFIIWQQGVLNAPDILYGARQLPERSFLPLVGQS